MSDLVGNPEDLFSRIGAHFLIGSRPESNVKTQNSPGLENKIIVTSYNLRTAIS